MSIRIPTFLFASLLAVLTGMASASGAVSELPNVGWYDVASSDLIIIGQLQNEDTRDFAKKHGDLKIRVIKVLKGDYDNKEVMVNYFVFSQLDKAWQKSLSQLDGKEVIVFANVGRHDTELLIRTNPRVVPVRKYSPELEQIVEKEVAIESKRSAAMANILKDFRSIDSQVTSAIDMITSSNQRDVDTGTSELVNLGCRGVPAIILNMNDDRSFSGRYIKIKNSENSFESFRTYRPQKILEALAAILNAITGLSFENIYNGGTPEERRLEYHDWLIYLTHYLSAGTDKSAKFGLCTA